MTQTFSHTWEPIKDLPSDWQTLGSSRLQHLAEVWHEQKHNLNQELLDKFMVRLKREWAIETGLIENLYKLDRDLAQTLITEGIESLETLHGGTIKEPGLTQALILDQQNVIEGLFSFIKGEGMVTTSYIKEIHQTLTRNQDMIETIDSLGRHQEVKLLKGEWKKLPNNPVKRDGLIHYYCPPEQVASEIDQLLIWHEEHKAQGIPPEVEAAWLHHRFTQIHPFQDGNGRVARALATLILIKAERFPLRVSYDGRLKYIKALEQADQGQLKALVDFFTVSEEKSFLAAMNINDGLLKPAKSVESVLKAIEKKMKTFREQKSEQQQIAKSYMEYTDQTISDLAAKLTSLFHNGPLGLDVSWSNPTNEIFTGNPITNFYRQLAQGAKKYNYPANLQENSNWSYLLMQAGKDATGNCIFYGAEKVICAFRIVISIHPVGQGFSGTMATTAFSEYQELSEGSITTHAPNFLTEQPFIFTYKDADQPETDGKYKAWLDEALAVALADWQDRL